MNIETSTIRIGELGAYLARPEGGSEAGMLLLPMITGIGERVRHFADEIARTGVTALAWDTWHGDSTDDTSRDELATRLGTLDDDVCLAEQHALADHLFGELGCTKAGVIGWCLGGRFALLLAARDPRLAGVVAYHPTILETPPPHHRLDAVESAASITAPVLVLYPEADTLVTRPVFDRLQASLQSRAAGASLLHIYPAAQHGFSDSIQHGNPVNKAAYELSWPQALAFVKTTTA
ncbi:dienelactone hydrolase family protein [Amycolatopsis sp. H20-H5]|uniref:dienelactone hydrolase family protein n=1 Tax=Amycolatopsis sp. H20-H5 TaxID=3046309 RepID=UPI002DB80DAE|nr:dienelactone hydrolase family protein [Amycolatopsis sp. H20-H5]MEC3978934.1 dienelactone hydrolase family protein [Amycolatopsis sp. H20-H5]